MAPPLELVDELVERSGGVPLYLEELLRFVLAVEAPARCAARRQIPATLRVIRGTDLAPEAPALLERAITAIAGGDDTADVMRAKEIAGTADCCSQ